MTAMLSAKRDLVKEILDMNFSFFIEMISTEIISVDSNTGTTTRGGATFVTARFESMTPLLHSKSLNLAVIPFCLIGPAYHLQEWMTPL